MWCDGGVNYHYSGNQFTIYMYQVNTLYTLNFTMLYANYMSKVGKNYYNKKERFYSQRNKKSLKDFKQGNYVI